MKFSGLIKVGSMAFFSLFTLSLSINNPLYAGAPFETTIGGIPVTWDGEAFWNADPGPLVPPEGTPIPGIDVGVDLTATGGDGGGGCSLLIPEAKALEVTQNQAAQLVEEAFKTWTSVSDSNLKVTQKENLPEEVTIENVEKYIAAVYHIAGQEIPHLVNTKACYDNDESTTCYRPVVWDRYGLITTTVFGDCAYNVYFAFAAVIPNVDNDAQNTIQDQNSTLKASQMVVSGACLGDGVQIGGCPVCSGMDLAFLKGAVTHEAGHFLGLDHTVNMQDDDYEKCSTGGSCSEAELKTVPTMVATAVPGADLSTLHEDDKMTFRTLYPSDGMEQKYCKITGVARTEVLDQLGRGLEVIAVKMENNQENWEKSVSTVAGNVGTARKFQGVAGAVGPEGKNRENCQGWPNNEDCGRFSMFVEPGTYRMVVRPFNVNSNTDRLYVDIQPLTPTLYSVLPPNTLTNPAAPINASSNILPNNNAGTVTCQAGQTKTINVKTK